jgi:hypothetical protein
MDGQPPAADSPAPPASTGGGAPDSKECVLCGERIASFADRCAHCGGFLPIAEGRAFSQHFFFLLCSMAIFLGTLLPWEGMWWDSNGFRSVHGAFLLLLSGYGMVAAYFNIFHRQMIVWPVILAAIDGTYAGWHRVLQIASSDAAQAIEFTGDLGNKKMALIKYLQLFGPGLWLVTLFASLFWLVFVMSVVQGGRSAAARKDAEKAARAAKK